jgi:hypothetical protein
MKKTITLLLFFAACVQLSAQKIKTAEQLGLTNEGIYIGVSTSFIYRGTLQNPSYIISRNLLDAQYRFSNRFSAGLGLGMDYEKSTSFTTYTLNRLTLLPEVRYWLHTEPQRLMPYLFLNYAWSIENQTHPLPEESRTYWQAAIGAGCTGWLNKFVGLQLRTELLTLSKQAFTLTNQPVVSTSFGVVFKTNR